MASKDTTKTQKAAVQAATGKMVVTGTDKDGNKVKGVIQGTKIKLD